jgi:phage nucleotide-binding protein
MTKFEIEQASDLREARTCGIIYGAPGTGKTTAIPFILQGQKKLLIDIDRSSQVLRSKRTLEKIDGLADLVKDVSIINVGLDVNKWLDILNWLEEGGAKDYAGIFIDNISELEHQMLTEYGRVGKNDGAPEQLHYNRTQFKIIDYVRRLRALDTNVIFTAWDIQRDVIRKSGEKYTEFIPKLSGKSVDTICGLCNVVAHIEQVEKGRFFRLMRTPEVYAKDQIQGRKNCLIPELI